LGLFGKLLMLAWVLDIALFIDLYRAIRDSFHHLCDYFRRFLNINVFVCFLISFFKNCFIFILGALFFCRFEIKLRFVQIGGLHMLCIIFLFVSSLDCSLAVRCIVFRLLNFLHIFRLHSVSIRAIQNGFILYLL